MSHSLQHTTKHNLKLWRTQAFSLYSDKIKHSHAVGVEDAFNVNEIYPLGENKDDSIFLTPVAGNEQLTSSQNGTTANDEVVESEAGVTSGRGRSQRAVGSNAPMYQHPRVTNCCLELILANLRKMQGQSRIIADIH